MNVVLLVLILLVTVLGKSNTTLWKPHMSSLESGDLGTMQGSGEKTEEASLPTEDHEHDASTGTQDSKRKQFFDKIAVAASSLLWQENEAKLISEKEEFDAAGITPQSDLTIPGRHIHIVTTAALPWFTGTAVNPLLRAAYLHDRMKQINQSDAENTTETVKSWVTLVIPWLELPEDQQQLYGNKVFETKELQEEYVRDWLRTQANMSDAADNLNIVFYNARYHTGLGSIFAMGDIIKELPQDELDVCILEEPEHVNWFRAPGTGWTKRYNFVLGIIHTNYDQYATQHYSGLWTAPAIRVISAAMVRAYCHKVIKLSDALQPFSPEKEVTEAVHGVRQEFIQSYNKSLAEAENKNVGQTYFIGKLLWTKGLDVLLGLQDYYKQTTGDYFSIDVYGSGPDQDEIARAYLGRSSRTENQGSDQKLTLTKAFTWMNKRKRPKESPTLDSSKLLKQLTNDLAKAKESVENLPSKVRDSMEQLADELSNYKFETPTLPKTLHEFRRHPIPASFPGRVDHAALKNSYKIFVNPSVSEVLCTTTFEALAMGKFAIIPVHPSNKFFMNFPNCLGYRNPYEFVANLQWALTHDPEPLTEEFARSFSWEAATDRFITAAGITNGEAKERELLGKSKVDERIAWFHNELGSGVKGDVIRKVLGAGPVSDQVKYESDKERKGEVEDDDEGLSRKFQNSAFVQAIRQATAISIPNFG